jgi:hydrogenase maturation protease
MQALLLAIGNDARQDDGLGWAFANALEKQDRFPGEIALRYQLQVEDADLIAGFNPVIFVDASKDKFENGFSFQPLLPALNFAFSTHALAPEAILAIAGQVCGHQPKAWLLAISGEHWALEFGLSPRANNNLNAALNFMEEALQLMQLRPELQ